MGVCLEGLLISVDDRLGLFNYPVSPIDLLAFPPSGMKTYNININTQRLLTQNMKPPFNRSHRLLGMNRCDTGHNNSLQIRLIEHLVVVAVNLYILQILRGPFAFPCIWGTCRNYLCAGSEIVEV